MRRALLPLLATLAVVPFPAAAEAPTTTRIETRPFYGATVTLEEGVRVFRPLPPHGRVIINPGGATPLNLNYEEHRSVSHNYTYDNASGAAGEAPAEHGSAAYAGDWGNGRRGGHHRGHAARGMNPGSRSHHGGPSGHAR